MQVSPCVRRYFLTFFSVLVYGFGIAGITYALYYYHSYVEGKESAAVLAVLYIADILTVGFMVVSIVAAFLHVFPLSIISSVVLIIAVIINIIIPVILLAKEQVFYDLFEQIWTSPNFNGVNTQLEKDHQCCGWDGTEERCALQASCRDVFEVKFMGNKYFICVFFFALALFDHFAVILSIFACIEDRSIAIQIHNDQENNDQVDTNNNSETDNKTQNASEDELSDYKQSSRKSQNNKRNYQPPQINPMPNFLIQKQKNFNPDYTYTYEYEYDYEEDVYSDTESK